MQKNGVLLAIIFSLIGALIGGGIWGGIVILTEYELGLIAWLIGGITGYAASYPAKGTNVGIYQIIAVVTSLIGIVFGKYLFYSYIVSDFFNGEIGMFDSITFGLFREEFSELFGGVDIIFVLLAVVTAWQIPAKLAAKREASMTEVEVE